VNARFVYSPEYDISFPLIDRLHPFDGRKYSRAWNLSLQSVGIKLQKLTSTPEMPIGDEVLALVHSAEYLSSLNRSASVAKAIEVPLARLVPARMLRERADAACG